MPFRSHSSRSHIHPSRCGQCCRHKRFSQGQSSVYKYPAARAARLPTYIRGDILVTLVILLLGMAALQVAYPIRYWTIQDRRACDIEELSVGFAVGGGDTTCKGNCWV